VNRNYFEFLYIIGRGGFGKVWKVRLKKNNELFALKEMSKAKVIDRRSEISIMSERNLLSKLHHSFIVNMYFAFQDFYNLYLVMDLLTGGDLRFHIAHKKIFTEDQTKFFIANMLLALDYIHSQNIIHRDIKPENLVLEKNGYLRITDFGVAKINEKDNSSETSGTPGYMAPEVILVQNHGPPSDFFALGVIGYEFMLGYRPYLGRGRKEIKNLIISKQAKISREELPDDWSENSRDFINLLLQRKPKKRLGYNGVNEIKEHPWMKDIDFDLLYNKKIEAPFIPPIDKENFDKKYCEGEDKVGETTLERYELYFNSELYEGVFKNYTYINKIYLNEYNNNRNIKIQNVKMINNDVALNKNKNFNTINYERNSSMKDNNETTLEKNTIEYDSKLKLKNNKENIDENIINNNDKINNINFNERNNNKKQFYKNNRQSSASTSNLNYKFNAPMVNENIICNNYINFNFNNYQNNVNNNTKNKELHSLNNNSNSNDIIIDNNIDVNSLKQLLNSHESNDINIYKNSTKKNINININDNHRLKNSARIQIPKSSSMKYLNNNNHFLSDNKKTTKIILIKNLNNNENENLTNLSNNIYNLKNSKMIRGLSDYNLQIDTNNIELFSLKKRFNQNPNKNRNKNKALNKTTSYDGMNMGNNIRIKNTELDNKLNKWIFENLKRRKNPKNLKINNQFSTINLMNENKKSKKKYVLNLNNFNYNNNLKKKNQTNSMSDILNDNNQNKEKRNFSLKNNYNPNFPNINNISNNLNKKSFDLNNVNINTNLINAQKNYQRKSFNTIDSAKTNSYINKVQSLKNIHNSINKNNQNLFNSNKKSLPISFNLFNFNNKNNYTRNRSKNNNLFGRNMNLNFGIFKSNKNFMLNSKIKNFNH
jgi:serine/threonine protein kinase